jgi:hypothetical protein
MMKYPKQPDLGVRLMLSEQVLARMWCLVAFMKAMNLLHRAMRAV